MRNSRTVIATVAFLVGLAAGFAAAQIGSAWRRAGHAGQEPDARLAGLGRAERKPPVPLSEGSPGGGPGEGEAIHERRRTPAGAPELPGGQVASRTADREDARSAPRSDGGARAPSTVRPGTGSDAADPLAAGKGVASTSMSASAGGAAGPSSGVPGQIETQRPTHGSSPGYAASPSGGQAAPSSGSPPNPSGAPQQVSSIGNEKPVIENDPESDRRPPVLEYLRFDPPEIPDGSETTLSVGVTDDLSGVKTVYGNLHNPSEVAIVPFSAQDEGGSGVFTAKITFPRQAETGVWYVANLQVLDRANNALIVSFAKTTVPQGGSLRVYSKESDSAAPDVHRAWVEKGLVSGGERNLIMVEIDDDHSGVASVTGRFQSPSRSAISEFSCHLNTEFGFWEGDVLIPANADCGEWTLQQLRVADKANNTAYLSTDSPQVGRVGFMVSGGGDCDSVPPTVDAFSFSPAIVSNATATEVILTATARDEGSGVASCFGRVEGPVSTNGQVPKIYFSCAQAPKDPEAPLTAKIPVPQYAAKGSWKLAWVQVLDKARNARTYTTDDPLLADARFTVE